MMKNDLIRILSGPVFPQDSHIHVFPGEQEMGQVFIHQPGIGLCSPADTFILQVWMMNYLCIGPFFHEMCRAS